jgi:hypothetical protein
MQVNAVKLLPVSALRASKDNPKKPMGARYLTGLRAALEEFGFAGVLIVAENDTKPKTYEILDGTTRLEELTEAGVKQVPCTLLDALAEGQPGWQEGRVKFRLAHDRHRKQFDESAVIAQLRSLASKGEDLKQLGKLAAKANLERLLSPPAEGGAAVVATLKQEPCGSLVLYGPAKEIEAIKGLLQSIKGRFSNLEKARKALGDAERFLQWDDDKVLALLLALVAKFSESAR